MSEWKKVKIGEICKIIKGSTGIASAEPGEYPLVVTAEERKTCSTYQFDCEAVCIPLVSSSGHGKKSLKNVHYQSGKFALGTILCAVIPNDSNELDARFLRQYLLFYKDTILVPLMKGAANVSLSMKDIATVEFPLPPIEKQRELSELFVSLQEKERILQVEYTKQFEYTKQLRQNILQDAIEGKLTEEWRKNNPVVKGNPDFDAEALFEKIQEEKRHMDSKKKEKSLPEITEDEKPFEIPEGWKWVRLNDLFAHKTGKTLNSSTNKGNNIKKYITTSNLYWNYFDFSKVKEMAFSDEEIEKYSVKKGDLLVCEGGDVGRAAIWNCDYSVCYQNHIHRLRSFYPINTKLYYYIFYLYKFSGYIEILAKGMGIQGLSANTLGSFVLVLPPLKEQEEIVNKVETLLAKVVELENQIQERKILSEKLAFGIIKEKLEGRT